MSDIIGALKAQSLPLIFDLANAHKVLRASFGISAHEQLKRPALPPGNDEEPDVSEASKYLCHGSNTLNVCSPSVEAARSKVTDVPDRPSPTRSTKRLLLVGGLRFNVSEHAFKPSGATYPLRHLAGLRLESLMMGCGDCSGVETSQYILTAAAIPMRVHPQRPLR